MALSEERMSEAEVSLRLAFHLLSYPASRGLAVVAVDGAQVHVHGEQVFDISEFVESHGWIMAEQKGKNPWQGRYERASQSLLVTSQSGTGDVVADVGDRRVRAEAKKGPLIPKAGSPEYPLMREAIGQLMTVEKVEAHDVLVVAVPRTDRFRALADRWRRRPLIERTEIHLALVGRDGGVEGLPDFLRSDAPRPGYASSRPLKEGRYRHYKGKEYIVLGVARHSETEEELVTYRQDYGERGLWVRPLTMFLETVEVNGQIVERFQYVGHP